MNDVERLQAIRDYLDEWEASYGFQGHGRPLPDHWGLKRRVVELRELAGEPPVPPEPNSRLNTLQLLGVGVPLLALIVWLAAMLVF